MIETGKVTQDELKHIGKNVYIIAFPFILENLSRTLIFIVDQLMLGHLPGENAKTSLAATAIAATFGYVYVEVLNSFSNITMALTARAFGSGDTEKLNRTVSTIFFLCLVTGVIAMITGVFLLAPIMKLFIPPDNPAVAQQAYMYFLIIMLSAIFIVFLSNFGAILRSCSDSKTPMYFGIAANFVNLTLNYLLIFGKYGFPRLELKGAAISSASSFAFYGISMLIVLLFKKNINVSIRYFDKGIIKNFFRLLLPAFVEPITRGVGFMVFMRIVTLLGTVPLAAHRIAISIESLTFMPGMAIAKASGILTGQYLGMQRADLAYLAFRQCLRFGFYLMNFFGIILIIFSKDIMTAFIPGHVDVMALGAWALTICAFEQSFLASGMILNQTLLGAGDTKSPLIVNTLALFCVRVPFAYIAGIMLDMGLIGIWIVMILDWGFRSLMFYFIYRRAKWASIKL